MHNQIANLPKVIDMIFFFRVIDMIKTRKNLVQDFARTEERLY